MKKIYPFFLIFLLLFSLNVFAQQEVVIEGTIQDADQAYVMLAYSPRARGNLNFDGFRSVGAPVNERGQFRLAAKNITPGANYRLFFPDSYVSINPFPGDHLQIDLYLTDPQQTFATGKGAGKFNVANLSQFQYDYIDMKSERSLVDFSAYLDSAITQQLDLLTAIYTGQSTSPLVSDAPNAQRLRQIIETTPLGPEGYDYLHNLLSFMRYSYLVHFLGQKNDQAQWADVSIDFTGPVFRHLDKEVYGKLKNINDWRVHGAVGNILQLEYLKNQQLVEGYDIAYSNWQNSWRNPAYFAWCTEFLKEHFNREVFTQYLADNVTASLTLGWKVEKLLEHLDLEEDNKYIDRIVDYQQKLAGGLAHETYALNQEGKTLDQQKFNELLSSYRDAPLLMVFWSAQFAGASIIDELPSLRAFEKEHQDQIDVVYICVDKAENKKMWAARIIDESWTAKHYFLPTEGNENTLKGIKDGDISSMCNGGATYTYFDRHGKISEESRGPFYLNKQETKKLFQ